ncbi:MAG: hypothetical protein ACE5EM_03840 [Sphingomonadales bacterium]
MTASPVQIGAVVLSPHLPWSVVVMLGVGVLALSALAAWRGARGWLLRLMTMLALLAGVINPTVIDEKREPLDDTAIVIVDESMSQSIGDRPTQTEQARMAVVEKLSARPGLETRVIAVGGASSGDEGGTRLFSALEQVLSQTGSDRVAGAILVTDGQVHDVPNSLPPGLDAPIHALITGSRGEIDRRLVVVEAPRYAIVGKTLLLTVRVEDEGPWRTLVAGAPSHPRTGTATVEVRVGGRQVFRRVVGTGADVAIPFELEHAGASVVEISASSAPGELTRDNNRAVFGINGVRDRLRVLLVSGEPHAGARVWRNLLKADPAVDLVHFTILRTPQDANFTPVEELSLIAFPTRELFEEKLDEFDLIIFDRYQRRNVLPERYLANVANYVKDGGALLIAAGPEFAGPFSLYATPLETILPARPTRRILEQVFKPELTVLGARHPVTAALDRGLSKDDDHPVWGPWLRQIEARARRGDVVMSGLGERPLLVLDRVGKGRVAQLLSDHAWLWARGHAGGGPQAELLRRLAHWLMKEPDLEEEAITVEVRDRHVMIEQRTLGATPPQLTITGPDGKSRALRLQPRASGRFAGSAEADAPGIHRISDGVKETVAVVGTLNSTELTSVKATSEILEPLIARTAGAVNWLEDDGVPDIRHVAKGRRGFGKGWIALRNQGRYRVTGFTEHPLAPPWLLLILILGGLLWAWRREGR